MAAFPRPVHFLNFIPFLIVLLSAKADTNVLLTGQTLGFLDKLSYANTGVSLTLQFNCDLVLYDSHGKLVWHSNTGAFFFRYCNLDFTENGRLVLRDSSGGQQWISPNSNSQPGKYVAVLRPGGQLSVFGPAVWGVGDGNNSNQMVSYTENLRKSSVVYNVLFSGQVLYRNDELSDNGHRFVMTEDCELILQNSGGVMSWSTWTKGNGKNCFARLNDRGELAIRDDGCVSVWSNEVAENVPTGDYVLVMQQNGNAVIYGPEVWSTAEPGLIEMPTA
ncbi:mannose-specific lectin 3-like [Phalaenopsis equestris]|uniref:mannose-specific lectin 3-like n=1 Tax=Phalaenopsis equestris TaxID=78828 RepID=UPI0009E34E8D|nr:mannose-specific lectin 3-like [Phalaenopsis equestris]